MVADAKNNWVIASILLLLSKAESTGSLKDNNHIHDLNVVLVVPNTEDILRNLLLIELCSVYVCSC